MVRDAQDRSSLFGRALAASFAIHVLVALLLPSWQSAQSSPSQPIEVVSFARLTRLRIVPAVTPAAAVARPEHRKPATQPFVAPRQSQSASRKRHAADHARKYAVARAAPIPAAPSTAAQPIAPAAAQPRARSTPAAIATATPAPTPSPQSGMRVGTGIMPLGATQDPVLAPDTLAMLQQRFTVHTTLLITVGEDGRTKKIQFSPPIDAGIERAIEAALAQASWDAAVCGGGVSCEGTARIKL
jgi:hypothetical protein